MRKVICCLLIATLLLHCVGAFAAETVADQAQQALLAFWTEEYKKDYYEGHTGHLEIKNTRVITIAQNVSSNYNEASDKKAQEYFGDVAYVVEFLILSDYLMTEPYYSFVGIYDHVIVHRDGTMEVSRNPFDLYRTRTYLTDFTGIIEEIDDLRDAYNGVFSLRGQ